ncbi:hepatitis A virus cellular receptor 2 [Salminus brasiliensis]|uniref:hepatitis A virus cellular receptor 2 n=1 Tax=Salminus brasiliensis TaxID=930266 RepID=UPI003B836EAF
MLTSVLIIILGIFLAFYEASILTVVGLVGQTVTLPCKYDVKTHDLSNICWGKDRSLFGCEHTLIATDGLSVNFRQSNRYSLPSMLHIGDVSLTIKKVQKADTGFYICRIEVPGLFNDRSYTVFLIVTNGLDPGKVNTHTEPPVPTDEQVGTQDVTAQYPRVGSVAQLVNTEDALEVFILTTLRVGAIIFIPGLIIALLWKLQRSRGNTNSSRKENTPTAD